MNIDVAPWFAGERRAGGVTAFTPPSQVDVPQLGR